MYTRRSKCKNLNWNSIFCRAQYSDSSKLCQPSSNKQSTYNNNNNPWYRSNAVRNFHSAVLSLPSLASQRKISRVCGGYSTELPFTFSRSYSSEGDESSPSGGKHVPVKDSKTGVNEAKLQNENVKIESRRCNGHGWLGEQDQKEWLSNKQLSFDRQKMESPFLTKRERFRNEFLRRVTPWEKITVSWDTFPYYVNKQTKNMLVECATSHLKQKQFASSYGARLNTSSGRILLQGIPGTELYRERMVKALAHDLQVPVLALDSGVHAPHGFSLECASESELYDEDIDSGEECSSYSEVEEMSNDEHDEVKSDESEEDNVDARASAAVLSKLVPCIDEFAKRVSGEVESETTSAAPTSDAPNSEQKSDRPFKRVQDIAHDGDVEEQDWYIAVEALCEVLPSLKPIIVYFPDSSQWLSRAVMKSNHKEFIQKLEEMFDQLTVPVVLIYGQNKLQTGPREKGKLVVLPQFGRIGRLPLPLHRLVGAFRDNKTSKRDNMSKVFPNILFMDPPKEEAELKAFHKQLEEDKKIIITRCNLVELHKVLHKHELSCLELLYVNTDGVILTKQNARQVVGWARNHYLSLCSYPSIIDDRLTLPRDSLETAISRLKEQEPIARKPSQNLKAIAKDDYEKNFVSAVVPPGEIQVKFEDIGALEDVKRTLNELVTLPMRRPELFSRGNLLRPCKGILLFGPPGTGKTLLAKALATEAGANFISVTGSTLTSKWFGDAEKLTKALFSFASKLAPVIIFVDEVDSLLGARGGAFEHEATRRMRNEFMAAWDGLRTKDSQRIIVLGATNRPFDLDDAVIRRLPRRIYVDLPDAENRMKILKIFLAQEALDSSFRYEELANATEGYSGSDLKNLCIAAAYKPVQEHLEEEKKGDGKSTESSLRPLIIDDFIQAKSMVGASVAYDAASMNELRKWNEQYGEDGSRKLSPFGFCS